MVPFSFMTLGNLMTLPSASTLLWQQLALRKTLAKFSLTKTYHIASGVATPGPKFVCALVKLSITRHKHEFGHYHNTEIAQNLQA